MVKKISLLIATRNRVNELKYTLGKSMWLIQSPLVELIICDDGSIDGTLSYLQKLKFNFTLLRNERAKGILHARNKLFNHVRTPYAITLDDDTNFIEKFEIEDVIRYFEQNIYCAVLAFKIIWSREIDKIPNLKFQNYRVKSFGAGAHAMNMKYWSNISDLPEWYKFYGEEDFITLSLFKKKKEVHFNNKYLVQHRVDLSSRMKNKDKYKRQFLALRSNWFNYLIFFPKRIAFQKILYSAFVRIKKDVIIGRDLRVVANLFGVTTNLILFFPKVYKFSNRLTLDEYKKFQQIKDAQWY